MKKKTIAIVGLGLIGGSLALALKKDFNILGLDINESTLNYCLANNIIDKAGDLSALSGADVVFVCTPLSSTRDSILQISKIVGANTVITDVASVKSQLFGLGKNFVGGHPMAGTEKSGIEAAKAHLFENAYYVVVDYEDTDKSAVDTVVEIVKLLGAKVIRMSASEHDYEAAKFSHLPHSAAYALVNSVIEKDGDGMIASSGFMDTTRIALSSPQFWTEVFKLNRTNLLFEMDNYISEYSKLKSMLEKEDYESIEEFLLKAKNFRESLTYKKPYLTDYSLDIDVKDKAGQIAGISQILYSNGISLSNIQVNNSREGIGGALRLYFSDEASYKKAKEVLKI